MAKAFNFLPRVYRLPRMPVYAVRDRLNCLILRRDHDGGKGWNLIGGGVYRGETLADGLARHLRTTLKGLSDWEEPDYDRPVAVGQYFPVKRPGFPWDPRKHAIAPSYAIKVEGEPYARQDGEALDFRWFTSGELPDNSKMGFGQGIVVSKLVDHVKGLDC